MSIDNEVLVPSSGTQQTKLLNHQTHATYGSTKSHSVSSHSHSSHSNSHSPRATITSVLDIRPNINDQIIPHRSSIHSIDTDSINSVSTDQNMNIPPLPAPHTISKSIKVLPTANNSSSQLVITKKENDTYYKQHSHKNQTKSGSYSFLTGSSIMIPSSPLSPHTPDMNHHIEHHLLRPCMYGTPHHNEAHMDHIGDSPIRRVIFNMLNSIIGAGVVGLPYVYKTSGLFGGLLLMVFFAFISAYSLKLLIISAKLCQQKNYEDLCEYLFGLKGYIFVSVTMLVFDFGATLSYLIILGDSATQIGAIWGYDTDRDRQIIIAIVSTTIILPTILPRDISKIEKVSTLSVFSVILIMLVVIYEWIAYRFLFLQKGFHTHLPNNMNWGIELNGIPLAMGIIAFALLSNHDNVSVLIMCLS